MEQKKDRRVRKTKTAVHEALLHLMKNKKLSRISVLELTEAADINRKTFYNHYSDIYAVLDEVENECVERLIALFPAEEIKTYIKTPEIFFSKLIREIQQNKDFYMLMIQSEAHSHISQKLMRQEKELLRVLVDAEQMDETLVEYFLFYVSSGTTSVINHWFMSDKEVPEETLASFFSNLFSATDLRKLVRLAHA